MQNLLLPMARVLIFKKMLIKSQRPHSSTEASPGSRKQLPKYNQTSISGCGSHSSFPINDRLLVLLQVSVHGDPFIKEHQSPPAARNQEWGYSLSQASNFNFGAGNTGLGRTTLPIQKSNGSYCPK